MTSRLSSAQFFLCVLRNFVVDDYKQKFEEMTQECKQRKQKVTEQQQLLEKKEIRVQNLEQQMRALERKYQDELKQKQKVIQSLQSELIEKSDQIAQLQLAPLTNRSSAAATAASAHFYAKSGISDPTLSEMTSSSSGVKRAMHNRRSTVQSPLSSKHLVDQFLDMNLRQDGATGVKAAAQTGAGGGKPVRSCTTPERRCLSRESTGSSYNSGEYAEPISAAVSAASAHAHHVPMPPPRRPTSGDSSTDSGAKPSLAAASRHRRHFVNPAQPSDTSLFTSVTRRPASAKKMVDQSAVVDTEEILQIARQQLVQFNSASSPLDVTAEMSLLGAAGGVGLAAVELAKAMGAKVVAAASSEEKLAVCAEHGADEGVTYAEEFTAMREAAGDDPYQNPRNTAAGTLKLLDSRTVAKRGLRFHAVAPGLVFWFLSPTPIWRQTLP